MTSRFPLQTPRQARRSGTRPAMLLVLAVLVAGCASTLPRANPTFEEGRALVAAGRVEEGLERVQQAAREQPANGEFRSFYFRQRDGAVQNFIMVGDSARASGAFDEAEAAYKRAQGLDPSNTRAKTSLEALGQDRRHKAILVEAQSQLSNNDAAGAYGKAKQVLAENAANREAQALVRNIEEANARAASAEPPLSPALSKKVTLELRDTPLRAVFELLAKHTGLNFVFDRDLRPDLRTTVFVRDTKVEDVIRFVLLTNQLDRKVLNENTLLIYPNTAAKSKDYKDLVMRSFYLANADAKQTANMIKTLVKTPDLFVDEKLNMVMMRDTAEAVRVAERLVANQDLAEPEVMLEVEVLEVGTNLLTEMGIKWPDQVNFSLLGAAGVPGQVTLPEWQNRNSNLIRLQTNDPLLSLNLKKQNGRTNVLANPRIRVKNREKARIHIGDKVPVITTTASASGFVGESVSYLDVGLKLEVEPQVYLEDEVGIKVGLEVSNIAQQIKSSSGTVAYQVGTRNTATTLRLKDGETQVLAGLINDEDRRSSSRVPGLGDIPVLEHLFGSTGVAANKTEIVLLITPRVIRNLARPDARRETFNSGTDGSIGQAPLFMPGVGMTTSGQGAVLSLPAAPPGSNPALNPPSDAGIPGQPQNVPPPPNLPPSSQAAAPSPVQPVPPAPSPVTPSLVAPVPAAPSSFMQQPNLNPPPGQPSGTPAGGGR